MCEGQAVWSTAGEEAGEGGLMERRADTADGQVQGTRVQLPPPVLERRARKP